MARGTLHASKPEGQRRRRNAPTHGERRYTDTGEVYGAPLAGDWSPEVRDWHEEWRRVPWARDFEATDWRRLRLVAFALEQYLRRPGAALLSEIRMNEERLGATFTDRMRARIVLERDEGEEPPALAPVTSISPRERLAQRLDKE